MSNLNQKNHPKIVILGAGSCGLGAAWRLHERHYENYIVYDKNSYPGGLASSFLDEKGFTWDIGGHVLFSHYSYFDRVFDTVLDNQWQKFTRNAYAYLEKRFIPYPLQNNIRHFSPESAWQCVDGLLSHKTPKHSENFQEWLIHNFGDGLAKLFMIPYNEKVWAYPLTEMSYRWVGERVSKIDVHSAIKGIILQLDDHKWGPNNSFRYPLRGGSGALWKKIFERVGKEKFLLSQKITRLDTKQKKIYFSSKQEDHYDILLTTIPLDYLITHSDLKEKYSTSDLLHSSVHCFGIGIKGTTPPLLSGKCWIYFSEPEFPFYRATLLSHYSPYNTPDTDPYYSLLLEVSESDTRQVNRKTIKQDVIRALVKANFISNENAVCQMWYHYEPYGYPTPSLHRDKALQTLHDLAKLNIYSRGRFGAWKYEVANQDHTFMQGVEVINKIFEGSPEITVWNPERINGSKH